MKKLLKSFLSMIAVVAMVLSLTTVVNAEDETYSLTITGTKTGHTYAVYQIFTGDISGTSHNYVLSNVKYGMNYIPEGKNSGDSVSEDELALITDADDFAQTVSLQGNAFKEQVSAEGQTVIDGLPAGYYLVKDNKAVTGEDASTKFILQVVGDTSVAIKSGVPSMEKKVKENVKDVTGNTDVRIPSYTIPEQYNDVADWNIRDKVPFQLIGTLPSNYDDYTTYKYVFHDVMSKGLTFNPDSLTVCVGDKTIGKEHYTVKTENLPDNCTFEVVFSDLKTIELVNKNSIIVIDFTATLNENAEIGLSGNPNEAYLEFSNNPNAGGEGETGTTPKDKVIVFTYELDVTKVDGENESTKLSGAEFKLLNSSKDKYAIIANNKVTGWANDEVGGSTLTSDAEGLFRVIGLDDGTYYLKETKAPEGYNLLSKDIEIVITANTSNNQTWNGQESTALTNLAVTADKNAGTGNTSTGIAGITVKNNKGSTLPETGGIGNYVFYGVGGVLMMGAAYYFVRKRTGKNI